MLLLALVSWFYMLSFPCKIETTNLQTDLPEASKCWKTVMHKRTEVKAKRELTAFAVATPHYSMAKKRILVIPIYYKLTFQQSSWLGKFVKENTVKGEFSYCQSTYQPLLSDSPFHSGSVRTILSINFFHSIPSEMTLCHSLHTSSAAQSDLASR